MDTTIPAFSIFSAISEVFVTIAVLHSIRVSVKTGRLPKVLFGATLGFELCVNVVYMAGRASSADKSAALSTAMKIFYAAHGILSLVMILALAAAYLVALVDEASGRENWFRRRRLGTWVLVFFWMVSVLTGEAIFVARYLLPGLVGSG